MNWQEASGRPPIKSAEALQTQILVSAVSILAFLDFVPHYVKVYSIIFECQFAEKYLWHC